MSIQSPKLARNRGTALVCVVVVAGMVGLSFAAVPLYRLFCQVTGFGGTTQRAEAVAGPVLERTMKVRFDGNVGPGLAWDFKPVDRQIELKVGEQAQGTYRATNVSDRPTTGTATFNVSPPLAGAYFVKIECFCFTEQTLAPGESVDMPVMFYIDPEIADDPDVANLRTVTLSYTFYPVERPAQVSRADAAIPETAQQPQ
jgi:cytochrome c oxidase assembly protein subunit 11